jgi:hypothetical protein
MNQRLFVVQIMCTASACVVALAFCLSLWRLRKTSVAARQGLSNEALINSIFSFFSRCKLRCSDVPDFSKESLLREADDKGWAGLAVTIQVPAAIVTTFQIQLINSCYLSSSSESLRCLD